VRSITRHYNALMTDSLIDACMRARNNGKR